MCIVFNTLQAFDPVWGVFVYYFLQIAEKIIICHILTFGNYKQCTYILKLRTLQYNIKIGQNMLLVACLNLCKYMKMCQFTGDSFYS